MIKWGINDNQDNWDELVYDVQFLINTRQHSSTGIPPLDLLMGRRTGTVYKGDSHLYGLVEECNKMDAQATKFQKARNEQNKKQFDKNRRNVFFKIGQEVLIKDVGSLRLQSVKFGNVWKRGVIVDKVYYNVFKVKVGERILKVNIRKILPIKDRKFISRGRRIQTMVEDDDDEDEDEEEFATEDSDEELMILEGEEATENKKESEEVTHPHKLTNRQVKTKVRGTGSDARANLEAAYFLEKAERRKQKRGGGRM